MRLRNIPGAKAAITGSSYVVQNPEEWKGKWKQCFTKEQPLHIEVGMGKGRFLMDMASLHPEINYVGVEMYDSVLLRALQKRERMEADGEKLDNLKFMCIDARILPDIFEKGEVQRIYLNFSDPWPKDRHAKRRLTSKEFLKRYESIIERNGLIEFKTDNKILFDFSLEEYKKSNWELNAVSFDLHNDASLNRNNVMTEYETKFSQMGNPIFKMILKLGKEI